MSLQHANTLEREGRLADALRLLASLRRSSESSSPMAKIYVANMQRIVRKLGKEADKPLQALLADAGLASMLQLELPARDREPAIKKPRHAGPTVTVVVPCYNAAQYLPATIASIQAQTFGDFECILIDDFSSDSSAEIAKRVTKQDPRFRFYQHRANGGLAASRNSGIRLARGSYVCFLDADDLFAPSSLTHRVDLLQRFDEDELVAGVFDHSVTVPDSFNGIVAGTKVKPKADYVDFVTAQGDCPFNANQPMLKRSVLIEMGGFPEKYPQAEDWRLWSKVLRAGYVFLPVDTVGSAYRQTANSMIRRAPLVHVAKSAGNFFRAHLPYADESDDVEKRYEQHFCASPAFPREAGFYKAKQAFIARLINFVGIELGRNVDRGCALAVTEAVTAIREVEQEFALAFTGHTLQTFEHWLEAGVRRYFGGDALPRSLEDVVSQFASEVLQELGVLDGAIRVGASGRILPRRDLNRKNLRTIDVLFIPHKDYHTRSFELLLPSLRERGISFAFVDISVPYRDERARLPGIESHVLSYNEFVFSVLAPRVIVCMNDWDTVVKPLVRKANQKGIPTIGIVEGVQDYLDVDTGRKRNPYREVSNVLLPGDFDRRYFEGASQQLWVTGVQRLEGLERWRVERSRPERMPSRMVVLNVNFSYGVLTDKRAQWVADVQQACDEAGYRLVVSQHPQDDGDLSAYDVDKRPLYDLMVEADFFISRFSGAILESLVIGCPVIYYNGHHELVDKFHDGLGAYEIADTVEQLSRLLKAGPKTDLDKSKFLAAHCGIEDTQRAKGSIERTVDCIQEILGTSHADEGRLEQFKASLLA